MANNEVLQCNESSSEMKNKTMKKERKNKKKRSSEECGRDGGDGPVSAHNPDEAPQNVSLKQLLLFPEKPAHKGEDTSNNHCHFWSTQPVAKLDEEIVSNEPIDQSIVQMEIRAQPFTLPDGFKWDTLNLNEASVLQELYTLLNENYVEDCDSVYRFDYKTNIIQWVLQPPGYKMDWHLGVRVEKSGRLVAFISGIPVQLRIYDRIQNMTEVNFLCVHKKLRSKRVAPVLIREIIRRFNLEGYYNGVYTAGSVLFKPVSTCHYWHRSLNPKKLIEIKFSTLAKNMTLQRTLKLYKLPDSPKTPGFRKLEPRDCGEAFVLLNNYLKKFDLVPVLSIDEFKHWFIPREEVIHSFVVEADDGTITDLVSYYTLFSSVFSHPAHKSMKTAFSFYNVSTKTPWVELMLDSLITANNSGHDVFNALDLMDNKQFLEPLKFGIGSGDLHYYLYNWRCPAMAPNKVGVVLQ